MIRNSTNVAAVVLSAAIWLHCNIDVVIGLCEVIPANHSDDEDVVCSDITNPDQLELPPSATGNG